MSSIRQVSGFPETFPQGTTEEIQYVFHFDKMLQDIGVPTTPIDCKLYNLSTDADVSADKLSGSASLTDYEFTSPLVSGLEKDVVYRLVAEVTVGTQTFSAYKDLRGEL